MSGATSALHPSPPPSRLHPGAKPRGGWGWVSCEEWRRRPGGQRKRACDGRPQTGKAWRRDIPTDRAENGERLVHRLPLADELPEPLEEDVVVARRWVGDDEPAAPSLGIQAPPDLRAHFRDLLGGKAHDRALGGQGPAHVLVERVLVLRSRHRPLLSLEVHFRERSPSALRPSLSSPRGGAPGAGGGPPRAAGRETPPAGKGKGLRPTAAAREEQKRRSPHATRGTSSGRRRRPGRGRKLVTTTYRNSRSDPSESVYRWVSQYPWTSTR